MQRAVDDANIAVSRAESIRKFRILEVDFTEEGGHLTPKLSLKRHVVMKDFADQVEALYSLNKRGPTGRTRPTRSPAQGELCAWPSQPAPALTSNLTAACGRARPAGALRRRWTPSPGSTCRSAPAGRWPWSGATARASPPPCACWPACCRADRGAGQGGRRRRPARPGRGQAAHRLLPGRRRADPAGHPVGAPAAVRPAARHAAAGSRAARDLLERFDLGQAAHRVTAGFSHGMGRRLSVVLAAFHRPRCCCSTSPSTASTRSAWRPPWTWSRACAGPARRC